MPSQAGSKHETCRVAANDVPGWQLVRILVQQYVDSLAIDLAFQNFADELARLEQVYTSPTGAMCIARADGDAVGCVGVRSLADGVCEMKRLYVSDVGRGRGLGRLLVSAALRSARELGYVTMRLDTLPSMLTAKALYLAEGFTATAPYYQSPIVGTSFMQVDLLAWERRQDGRESS